MSNPSRKLCATALCVAILGGSLTACVPMLFGGAAMSALVVTDRRTSGTQLEDEGIELRAAGRIRESLGDRVHINVTSFNRQVLVTGEASNPQDRQLVEQIVSRVENVRSMVNEVSLSGNTSLTQRSTDSLTTGKVKAALLDAKDMYSSAFKVVTERGTTYLMGLVTQREAARATEITRSTSGVQKVVRVFEIISEAELQRILPQTAPVQARPSTAPKT